MIGPQRVALPLHLAEVSQLAATDGRGDATLRVAVDPFAQRDSAAPTC
jgi:hypothetical protein